MVRGILVHYKNGNGRFMHFDGNFLVKTFLFNSSWWIVAGMQDDASQEPDSESALTLLCLYKSMLINLWLKQCYYIYA